MVGDGSEGHERGWIAGVDLPGGDVSGDHAPCGSDGTFGNCDTGAEQGSGGNPSAVAHRDRLDHEAEGRIGPIVIASAEVSALGDADIGSEADLGQIVDPGILADPGVVTDRKFPWVLDSDARLDDDAVADGRTEGPEQKDPQSGRWEQCAAEQWQPEKEPNGLDPAGPAGLIPAIVESGEVDGHRSSLLVPG